MTYTAKLSIACVMAAAVVYAQEAPVSDTVKLQRMAARFAPTEIGADLSTISPQDRRVLAKLVGASKIIDALFLRQVWAANDAIVVDLAKPQDLAGGAGLQ